MSISDLITLIASVFAVIISSYVALKGARPKQFLDGSVAAENFQDVVIKLQGEVKDLRDKMDGKQLKVHMTIEIDKAPIVDDWQWVNSNDVDTKKIQPRKNTGGLGMR